MDVRSWLDAMAFERGRWPLHPDAPELPTVFLGWCRERGLIESDNAASGIKLPVRVKPEPRPSLTKAMARLIRIKEPDDQYRLMWRILEETGMRPSEALKFQGKT